VRLALVFPGCFRTGGVERIVWEAARNLSRRNSVTVLADYWEDCGAPAVGYRKVSPIKRPRFLVPLSFSRRATRATANGSYDRVVSFGANCPGGDVLWVSSVHRAWLERSLTSPSLQARGKTLLRYVRPRNTVLLALERRLFGGGDYRTVITVSDRVADDLARLYGVPSAATVTIPNGFSLDEFSPARRLELREDARKEVGLDPDAVALLMVANELPRKGFGVLLDAVAAAGDPRLHVLLVGRVPPNAYREQIERLGLASRVHYLGTSDDVGRCHAAADLFVLPTRYEAACLAIVEALGSGLPVITTDVPGAGDNIRPGVNGLLQADPLDADELAELLRIGLDAERRAAWSAAAPTTVEDLQWPKLMERVQAVLETHGTKAT
jgi:UDP-glucose:(heptosyl)LPS alpha-1,3-glucosyltransferase